MSTRTEDLEAILAQLKGDNDNKKDITDLVNVSEELLNLNKEVLGKQKLVAQAQKVINDLLATNNKLAKDRINLENIEKAIKEAKSKIGNNEKEGEIELNELTKRRIELILEKNALEKESNRLEDEYNNIITDALDAQEDLNEKIEERNRLHEEEKKAQELLNKLVKEGLTLEEKIELKLRERIGHFDKLKKGFNEIKSGYRDLGNAIKAPLSAYAKISQAATDYTRAIGGTEKAMNRLRQSTIDFLNAGASSKYNIGLEEAVKLQGDYAKNVGRAISLNSQQLEAMAQIRRAMNYDDAFTADWTSKLEQFGISPVEAANRLGKMFDEASDNGIVFENYAKNIKDNIQMASNYTFAEGIRGLEKMAKQATAIKLNMEQVTRFADKVSSLEGAVQTGANLSVLGGSFAMNSNPLAMLYEGLNDVGKLEERIVKMFGGLGKWDAQKGQIDISAFNRLRIKAAAEASGLDYSNLMEMINTNARGNEVEKQIRGKYTDEQIQLLRNIGQIDKNNRAFVNVGGIAKNIDELTEKDFQQIKNEHGSDSDKLGTIAQTLKGYVDVEKGLEKTREVAYARLAEDLGMGELAMKVMSFMSGTLMSGLQGAAILGILTSIQSMMAIGKVTNGGGNLWGSLGKNKGQGGYVGNNGSTSKPKFIGNTNRGKKVYYDGNNVLLGDPKNGRRITGNARKNILRSLGYTENNATVSKGMKGSLGIGKSLGAGLGSIGGMIAGGWATQSADEKLDNGTINAYDSEYTWKKFLGSMALYGGMGAGMGATFGPLGALVGAIGGALYGAYDGNSDVRTAQQKQRIREMWGVDLRNEYNNDELEIISGGYRNILNNDVLKEKMRKNGDLDLIPRYHSGSSFINPGHTVIDKILGLKGNEKTAILRVGEQVITPESRISPKKGYNYTNSIAVSPYQSTNNDLRIKYDMPTTFTYKIDYGPLGVEEIRRVGSELKKNGFAEDIVNRSIVDRMKYDSLMGRDRKENNHNKYGGSRIDFMR